MNFDFRINTEYNMMKIYLGEFPIYSFPVNCPENTYEYIKEFFENDDDSNEYIRLYDSDLIEMLLCKRASNYLFEYISVTKTSFCIPINDHNSENLYKCLITNKKLFILE